MVRARLNWDPKVCDPIEDTEEMKKAGRRPQRPCLATEATGSSLFRGEAADYCERCLTDVDDILLTQSLVSTFKSSSLAFVSSDCTGGR